MVLEIRKAVAEESRLFFRWDCNGGRDPQGRFGRGLGLELGAWLVMLRGKTEQDQAPDQGGTIFRNVL